MNIALIFLIIIGYLRPSDAKRTLKQVNVVFRHGDRTPVLSSTFPTDLHYDSDFYPFGYDDLTNSGKLRAFELGSLLHERYKNFLGEIYIPELLHAQSSDFDRTKMSLQLVLAGLFPPTDIQKWHKTINWQPIPITYTPRKDDDLLLPFYQENYMNLTLPEWPKKIFPKVKLYEGAIFDRKIQTYNNTIVKSLCGKLLTKITKDMLAVTNNTRNKKEKILLYSGHNMNVAGILKALNIYKPHIPQFSSAVIIELHEVNYKYYVKVLYYRGVTAQLLEMEMPGCTTVCPIEKYLSLVKNVTDLKM